jgi:hypothetical protein
MADLIFSSLVGAILLALSALVADGPLDAGTEDGDDDLIRALLATPVGL